MARLLVPPTVLLTLAFALVIGLIRARPYHDAGLRAALVAPDCASACFMDIRPGVTTAEEAIELLTLHPWVDHVIINESYGARQRGFIGWAWSGQQPAWVDDGATPGLWIRDNVVRFVGVPTTIPFGDLWLAMPPPALGTYWLEGQTALFEPVVVHYVAYPDIALTGQISTPCPLRPARFWSSRVRVQYYVELSEYYLPYDLRRWMRDIACRG